MRKDKGSCMKVVIEAGVGKWPGNNGHARAVARKQLRVTEQWWQGNSGIATAAGQGQRWQP